MQHHEIKLNNKQKLTVIYRMLNNMINVKKLTVTTLILAGWALAFSEIHLKNDSPNGALGILARLFISGFFTGMCCLGGFLVYMIIRDIGGHITESLKIRYEREEDSLKKEILDNVVDDEVLK